MLTPILTHGTYENTIEAISDGRIKYPAYCWLTDVEQYGFLNRDNELETIGTPCFEGTQESPIILSDLQDGIYEVKGYHKIVPSDASALNTDSRIFVVIESANEIQKIRRITPDDLNTYTVQNETVTNIDAVATESYLDSHGYITQSDIDGKMNKISSPAGDKLVVSDSNGGVTESDYTTNSFLTGDFTTPQAGQIAIYSGSPKDVENSPYTVSDLIISLSEASTPTTGYLKTYELYQGGNTAGDFIGKIDIPKDLVVTSGEVVTNPVGQPAGTYIKLVIANQTEPIYINVADLCSNGTIEEVTQAEYDALPSSKLTDGVLYAIKDASGGGGGGSTVVVTPIQLSGTKIATITVDNVPSDLYSPSIVKQSPSTVNSDFEILFSGTADNTERTESVKKSSGLKYNPNGNALKLLTSSSQSGVFTSANDYGSDLNVRTDTNNGIFMSTGSTHNLTVKSNTSTVPSIGVTQMKNGTSTLQSQLSIRSDDILLFPANTSTWDGSHNSLKAAIAAAGGGGDTNVTQTPTSTSSNYEILFSGTADNNVHTEGAGKDGNLIYNPGMNNLIVKDDNITSSTKGIFSSINDASITLGYGVLYSDSTSDVDKFIKLVFNPTDNMPSIDLYYTTDGTATNRERMTLHDNDIVLEGAGTNASKGTWDGINTSLKAAIAAASGGGSISDFTPPTTQAAGVHGLVPAPAILEDADNKLFLLSDGTWEFKGHYEDTQMKEENVPLNFYIDGNGDSVVVETWKPQHKVVEADLDAGGISYDLLSNDNYQTQRGLTPNEYISEFTNKNIHLEVESGDAYTINKYHIPTGENSVSMDIDAGDINLSSTWDGTNTSLKDAIAALSNRITALGG